MWPHCASFLVSCLVGLLAATSFAQQVDVVGGIAAENANLSAQLSADATASIMLEVEAAQGKTRSRRAR
jgi:hypothetical protein